MVLRLHRVYFYTYVLNIDSSIPISQCFVDIVLVSYHNRKKWYRISKHY